MDTQTFTFAASRFAPVAIGFFGLATGYFIWGGQALFGFPKASPEVNKTMGMWGFWMPGFMQFITGTYLLVGLTWFNVFGNSAPLYMAGLAFTAYGIHWFAMAHRRYIDSSAQPDGWMAIAFLRKFSKLSRSRRDLRHAKRRNEEDIVVCSRGAQRNLPWWLPGAGSKAIQSERKCKRPGMPKQ
jgi:hypothetical protein